MKQDKGQGTIRAYLGKSASFFYYKRLLLLLAVLVLLIIALAVWTASRLQMAMNKSMLPMCPFSSPTTLIFD